MGDVSAYMKLVKQRMSIWYNKAQGRFGTLWAERFKSVLVGPGAVQPMMAYVDLNCVRAGLAGDPKDYRYCGYAEAVAGNLVAQEGLRSVLGGRLWEDAQEGYRQILFGSGGAAREGTASMARVQVREVLERGGKLPLEVILRCRIRYFSDGAVLGTKAFVEGQLGAYRRRSGRRQAMGPGRLPDCTDWGDLVAMRGLRQPAIG
jgi:hypothetical protein